MDERQQQIMMYFIEEAKEHLDTLEKGLLDLDATMQDPETLQELFRAAHSVKGGAAMLGFSSIQKTAHRLEDAFKILKENPIEANQKLETLFLKGFDTLRDLLNHLASPEGLSDEESNRIVKESEPAFIDLEKYLHQLIGVPEDEEIDPEFGEKAVEFLREMLQIFKQTATDANRKKLGYLCTKLAELDKELAIEPWQKIVKAASQAIANPDNLYPTLAPVIIKELKMASDLVVLGQTNAIGPSPVLVQLAGPAKGLGENQIAIDLEPKAAAKALLGAFKKKQLVTLVKLLAEAVKSM
ncbi:Hpt domain-containing protein [Planktothricoides raciborskii]|uniref:Hpt domain-containing protein n=1 Tax=Planktothricoides raciborskii GIHE-MW2 TaxID=2792601 RepID=A0AAU8JKN7_9CYAN